MDRYRIRPGETLRLAERSTDDDGGLTKDEGKERLKANTERARDLQEQLYAEGQQALLFVFQAMDAGGKDSTTEHVFGPLNPQGVNVASFKTPTELEQRHDFLWRVHAQAPPHGLIKVFNRSHYEDVLIVRVHGWAAPDVIERRYDHIRHFESLLADARTRVVKVMLHISKDYQLERFRRRLERPDKHWKFNPGDLDERKLWDDYRRAFEVAIERTTTEAAPWYVVPAETRWYRNLVVSQILVDTLEAMDPQYPEPTFDPADYPPGSIA
ncbi:PPK2 family polyphosphate kinase [Rubrivirga litoralis]|uniref:Polyphosphate kinase 2 family protein n=1 Tax=Rubrivirga litoralis TaxID=3075598 RepID=A0ABU3BMR0_9BACT|nr:PPK2 family polyphosphate kinase [Rubrivirga sp. F394]MDT0630571.1 polyphosphate kinase 2 family protein [Rubrivirga sp. F394]